MAMAVIWCILVIISFGFGIFLNTMDAVSAAVMTGAGQAIELCLSIAGMICLWTGVMEVMNACGISRVLARLFRPLLRHLFPNASRDEQTLASLSGNFSANLLGLGNAATPLGMAAAQRMARGTQGVASNELCLLVVMNTASIQLFPATIAAVRGASGATSPLDILPAVWITSLASVCAGLLTANLLGRWCK